MISLINLRSSIFSLIAPFPRLTIQVVTLITIASLLEGVTLSLVIPLLQGLMGTGIEETDSDKNFLSNFLSIFFDRISPEQQFTLTIIILLLLTITKGVLKYSADFSLRTLQLKVGLNLRDICIQRFLNLGISYYSRARGGDLLSYVNEHAQRCENLTLYIGSIFSEVLIIFSFLILLFSISWQLTLLASILLCGIAFGLKRIVKSIREHSQIVTLNIEEFSSRVTELISGIRVIKSFTAEEYENKRLSNILDSRYQAEKETYAQQVAIQPITDTIGSIIIVGLIVLGKNLLSQEIVLPLLLTFLLILVRMFPRVNQLNSLRGAIAGFSGSYESIQCFLKDTETSEVSSGNKQLKEFKKEISFESVNFSYSDSLQPTLKQVNLKLPKGSITALLGTSGSGKSTLADLLMRFYEPESGKITIDGQDIREFNTQSLRQQMAIVSQDTFLFNATVRDNIQYGNPGVSEKQILEAARLAYAEDFIQALPNGFDTVLGDRGVCLSGGQRQRLAIARAILRNPKILILDEATSALDSSSEKIVQQALDEVGKNRTVLIITHRLSTIKNATQIAVLDSGKILEFGSHEELLSKKGFYYKFQQDQSLNVLA